MAKRSTGSITRAFTLHMVVLATLALSACAYLLISMEVRRFRTESVQLKERFLQRQRQALRSEVEQALDFIRFKKAQTETRLKQDIRSRTLQAHAVATHLYHLYQNRMSPAQIGEMIKESFRPVRFNNGRGYFFATSLGGIEQLFADRPELEGKNLVDLQDSRGQFVIRDMIHMAKTRGEGFTQYTWTKPGTAGRGFLKIAFIKYFSPLDWFIGTGEYIDDVTNDIQVEILDRLSQQKFGETGRLFAGPLEGTATPVSERILSMADSGADKQIVSKLMETARSGKGFLRCAMPGAADGGTAPWLGYAVKIDDWQWYVGAGVYLDEIDRVVAERQAVIYANLKKQLAYLVMTLAGLLVIIALATRYMAKKTGSSIALFASFFRDAATASATIDPGEVHFTEFSQIAESANQMIRARKTAESAREHSEKRFRDLTELLPEAIFETDAQGRLTFVNQKAYSCFGYSPEDFSMEPNALDMIPAEERPKVAGLVKRMRNGESVGLTEFWALRKDGTRFPAMVHISPVLHQGKPDGFRGFLIDITDQKNMEVRFQQAQKMEAIGALAGGIAHDFNNILSAILGYAELSLSDAEPDSVIHGHLVKIFKAGERARDLIKQILTFSRQAEQDLIPMAVSPIAKEAFKLLRASLPTYIDMNLDIQGNPVVMADPTQIHQVIMNLCTNAAHAMGEAGGVLTLALALEQGGPSEEKQHPDPGSGKMLRLTVSDTGHGIPLEIQDRIFDPFFTTKPKGEGTGMGLSVVHGIVQSHGGAIELHSRPAEGTTFHILLPAVESAKQGESTMVRSLPTGSERVLFVDDEEFQVDLGRQMLEKLGYKVTSFTDSLMALDWFRQHSREVDLVITDMTMPQMTGDVLAKALMAIRPGTPVIICTGFSNRISEQQAVELGIAEFVMKPVVLQDLARMVRKVLDRERSGEKDG